MEAKRVEKERTELEKRYYELGEALSGYFGELAKEIMKPFARKTTETSEPAPSETDSGFTDETIWGVCTPAFILENGMAENEEKAVEIAKMLKENGDKKNSSFFKELFVKAQFRRSADQRMKSADVDFAALETAAREEPVKASVTAADVSTAEEKETEAAHPAVATQQVVNPMEKFMQGIPLEDIEDKTTANPQPVPVQPAANLININGILYEITIDQNGSPVMTPIASLEGQVNPTETQQVPNPHPAGFIVKEKELRELVDEDIKIDGELPSIDPSLIKDKDQKIKIQPETEKEEKSEQDILLSIVKGGHPEISEEAGNTLLWDVLGTIRNSGFSCDFRELRDEEMKPVGVYEFHIFNGDQEINDLKFIVDLGKIFDKRSKFCIGASAGLESKEWFELQKNVGKNLVYTDEILKNFFSKGRKWLFNQKSMYNRQWREINKNFVDLSTIPDSPNKESRQKLNGIISDLYNCRELQAVISDVIPDPRFRVIEYENEILILSNDETKDNILGSYRKDPHMSICYGGDGKNIATVQSTSCEAQITVPHNSVNK